MVPEHPHIVIVGGGFGGLAAARALRRAPARITMIDRRNHHVFQPLLYQVATAALSPSDIASPIRWILRRQRNVQVLLAEVRTIALVEKKLILDRGELSYDYLILATGATHAYFGHDDWAFYALGLKTLDDALAIRRRVLLAFEGAERESDPNKRRCLLTFVIVGGGPTGVEMAGALAEVARHTLKHDFRAIDSGDARILLLEGGPTILPAFPSGLRAFARGALEKLGIEVRTDAHVTHVEPGVVSVGSERIAAGTILWAAGVAASPLGRALGVPVDRAGRVLVEPDLSIPTHPDVFAVGDLALFVQESGLPLPGVAPVAEQQGEHGARNILRTVRGEARQPFRYVDHGNLATIGRGAAVADFGRLRLTGMIAWLAWLFVHVMLLIGFRNRVLVMLQWAWSYLTYQRSARLITGDSKPVDASS